MLVGTIRYAIFIVIIVTIIKLSQELLQILQEELYDCLRDILWVRLSSWERKYVRLIDILSLFLLLGVISQDLVDQ